MIGAERAMDGAVDGAFLFRPVRFQRGVLFIHHDPAVQGKLQEWESVLALVRGRACVI